VLNSFTFAYKNKVVQYLFYENQKLSSWRIWLGLGVVNLILWAGLVQQIILKQPFGSNPLPNEALIALSVIVLLISAGYFLLKMQTLVDEEGIYVSLNPFGNNYIYFNEISMFEKVACADIRNGIRAHAKYGKTYCMDNKHGVQINLKSGRAYLIGSNRTDELLSILKGKIVV
jgi:hypothetical protein